MDACNYPNCIYIQSYEAELEEKKAAYEKLESDSDEQLKEIFRLRGVIQRLQEDLRILKEAIGSGKN